MPGPGDHAVITASGSYAVTVQGAVSLGDLTVGAALSSPQLRVEGKQHTDAAVTVAGSVSNQGTIELTSTHPSHHATLVNGFEPDLHDSFAVATFGSRIGTFASTNLPSPHLYGWAVNYTNTSVSLTVVNTAPTFDPIDDQEIDEETELGLDAGATDTDTPSQTLTYSLLHEPLGATIDAGTGAFSWIPTEFQGPDTYTITVRVVDDGSPNLSATNQFDVIVNEANGAPVFNESPTNQVMDERTLLTVTNMAHDADNPTNELSYALLDAPAGASINATNGIISWIPAEESGPGTNMLTSVVTDNGIPPLSATNAFEVIVNEINLAPEFKGTPDDVTIDELTLLTVTNAATDPDIPANALSYVPLAPPAGAVIDAGTGIVTWAPAEDQGPGTNTLTTIVTDDGVPNLSTTNSFQVIVGEVNRAPVLEPFADYTIHAETPFIVGITATDSDLPTDTLTYRLVAGPAGALVDGDDGIFRWTPAAGDAGSTNPVTVAVSDDGVPGRSDTNSFSLIVVDPLAFTSIQSHPTGFVEITWNAVSGTTYRVTYTDDLISGARTNLPSDVTATGSSAFQVDSSLPNEPVRFYDVHQVE